MWGWALQEYPFQPELPS